MMMRKLTILYIFLCFGVFYPLRVCADDTVWEKMSVRISQLETQKNKDLELAGLYLKAGRYKSKIGFVYEGHQYYYKAIRIYESFPDQWITISTVYHSIAADYLQLYDLQGLERTIKQLQILAGKSASPPVLYHLYSIKGAYFYALLKEEVPRKGLQDSSLIYFKKSIDLAEQNRDSLGQHLVYVWNYYNAAFIYSTYYSPQKLDSVIYFLEKMEKEKASYEAFCRNNKMNVGDAILSMQVSVLYLKSCVAFHQGQFTEAEEFAFTSLNMLNQMNDNQASVLNDYETLYKLLNNIYEKTQRPFQALKYQKLLSETQKQLYNINKAEIINKLMLQYESEQKEFQIARLKQENHLMNRNIIISMFLAFFFLLSLVLSLILFNYRKRTLNRKIYETLMDADLQKEQFELNMDKIHLLQEELEHLTALANESEEKAKQYEKRLSQVREKLTLKPDCLVVDKLKNMIQESRIDKKLKQLYLSRLESFDILHFENLQISAKERLTAMDLKYMCCFAIEMDTSDISLLFNVEQTSVHTVHYRIRKKIGKNIL